MLYLILSITLKTKIIWYISIRLLYPPRYHMIITIIHDTIWYLIYCLIYYVCHFKIHCLGQNHRGRCPWNKTYFRWQNPSCRVLFFRWLFCCASHGTIRYDLHQSIWLSWSKSVNGWKWSMWHFNHYSFRYSQLLKRICWILTFQAIQTAIMIQYHIYYTYVAVNYITNMYVYIYIHVYYTYCILYIIFKSQWFSLHIKVPTGLHSCRIAAEHPRISSNFLRPSVVVRGLMSSVSPRSCWKNTKKKRFRSRFFSWIPSYVTQKSSELWFLQGWYKHV